MEEHFGTNYTDAILECGKRVIKQADRVSKLEKCRERAPLIVEVVNKEGVGPDYWILHYILVHAIQNDGFKALSWMLAQHSHGSKPSPLCDKNNLDLNPIGHLLIMHHHEIGLDRTPVVSVDQLVTHLAL